MAIYHDANDRRNFLSLLALAVHQFEWTCHAFCLMTNHYHLVLDTTRQNISPTACSFSTATTPRGSTASMAAGDTSSVNDFGADRSTKNELEYVCLYVMENPVRAGLCKEPEDWPWSACRFELG